jgi:hypothetical protein
LKASLILLSVLMGACSPDWHAPWPWCGSHGAASSHPGGLWLGGWPPSPLLVVFFLRRIHVEARSCRRGRPCAERRCSLMCCWRREALRLNRWHAGVVACSRCA